MAQSEQGRRSVSSPDNNRRTRRQWSGELGGPHWPEIQQWHAQNFGRAIGADIYAIRHTTGVKHWTNDRVLLLFPNTQTTDLCLVGPRVSTSQVPHERDMEDEGYRSDFVAQFSPSKQAYRHPSWEPEEGMTAFESFLRNASSFSVVVHKRSFSREDRKKYIDEALTNARALQERGRVRSMDVEPAALVAGLDSDSARFLAQLGTKSTKDAGTADGESLVHRIARRLGLDTQLRPDDVIDIEDAYRRILREEGNSG